MCAEPVRARQVDQFDGPAVRLQRANVPLYGDARVVADALPQAGQTIEERALAGIGPTDNRNAGFGLPACGNV